MSESGSFAAMLDGGLPQPLDAIYDLGRTLNIAWPTDFATFYATSGGGEGWIGETYLALWPPDEIMLNNELLQVPEFAPHLVGFATDGGGEMFAFDRTFDPPHIVMLPMIGLDSPRDFGSSFVVFLRRLQSGDIPGP